MQKFTIYNQGTNFFSNQNDAIALASKSFLGEIKKGKAIYSILEALYLIENQKATIEPKNKKTQKKLNKIKHSKEYLVFSDLKDKGHVVKEGLKFGTDFRVYNKGHIPGKNHAKYLLHIVESSNKMNLKDFCAKARIAHSTGKTLLLAIIDSEHDVNYYEVGWKNIL
jgi:tRNA-intron endonuclease